MFFIIALLGVSGYFAGLRKSLIIREKNTLHSTPIYHGVLLAVNSSLASILTLVVWLIIEKNIFYELKFFREYLYFLTFIVFSFTATLTYNKIKHEFKARDNLEKIIKLFLLSCSSLAILVTIGIFLSVIFESQKFFNTIPIIYIMEMKVLLILILQKDILKM